MYKYTIYQYTIAAAHWTSLLSNSHHWSSGHTSHHASQPTHRKRSKVPKQLSLLVILVLGVSSVVLYYRSGTHAKTAAKLHEQLTVAKLQADNYKQDLERNSVGVGSCVFAFMGGYCHACTCVKRLCCFCLLLSKHVFYMGSHTSCTSCFIMWCPHHHHHHHHHYQ